MKTRHALLLVLGIACALSGPGLPAHAQTKLEPIFAVVNQSAHVNTLSKADLRNIYLGRRRTWGNGNSIVAFMRPPHTGAGLAFYRNVLGMTPGRFRYHWHGLQLSGQATIPRTLGSANDVVVAVASTPGAVAYMTQSEVQRTQHLAGKLVKVVPLPR